MKRNISQETEASVMTEETYVDSFVCVGVKTK